MLDTLITSKTRVKLLMKFFMNPDTRAYLRELATEFGESTNSIRVELNRLSKANLLSSENAGRTIEYCANVNHSLFDEIRSLVEKYMGIDQIIDKLVKKLGDVEIAYLIGDYAKGIDSGLVDIILIGDIDKIALERIVKKREKEIRIGMISSILYYTDTEVLRILKKPVNITRWTKDDWANWLWD